MLQRGWVGHWCICNVVAREVCVSRGTCHVFLDGLPADCGSSEMEEGIHCAWCADS